MLGGGIYRGRYPRNCPHPLCSAQSNLILPTWSQCPFPQLADACHLLIFNKNKPQTPPMHTPFYLILPQYETVKNAQIRGRSGSPFHPRSGALPALGSSEEALIHYFSVYAAIAPNCCLHCAPSGFEHGQREVCARLEGMRAFNDQRKRQRAASSQSDALISDFQCQLLPSAAPAI